MLRYILALSCCWCVGALLLACAAPPPVLTAVEPPTGPEAGGTTVLLEGEELYDGLEVWFGDARAEEVEVLAPTAARVVTPPGTGTVDVRVVYGSHEAVLEDGFRYVPAPTVTAITPSEGFVEGGTGVRIEGTGFADGARVTIGGREVTDLVLADSETIMGRTPPGPPGPADVVVRNPDGQEGVLADGFTYVSDRCRVVEVTPGYHELDVPVTARIVVVWDADIVPASAAITLRSLARRETVPVDITVDGRTATVTPRATLRFWGDYSVEIGPSSATSGTACLGETTVFSAVRPQQVRMPLDAAPAYSVAPVGAGYAITSAGGYEGVQLWSLVSDPPALVSDLRLPAATGAVSTTPSGDRAFVAMGYAGVAILDVSDPAAPIHLATARTPGHAWHAVPRVESESTLLFVADGVEGVRVLDVTDPEGFFEVAAIDPSGVRRNDTAGLDLVGDRLAIANGSYGYALADVSSPHAPTILGVGYYDANRVVDVELEPVRGVLYAARGPTGLLVVDADDPSLPVLRRVLPDASAVSEAFDDLDLDADTLVVAARRTGVVAFDIDGAGMLTRRSPSVPTSTRAAAVHVAGGRWLIASHETFAAYDPATSLVSAPATSLGDVSQLAVIGEHLFAAANLSGLQVYDASAPEAPRLVARMPTPAVETADVAASNVTSAGTDRVIVGDGRLGIAVFDATDPENPTLRGSNPTSDRSRGVMVRGDHVFLCDDNFGLTVFDISEPDAPTVVSRTLFPPEANDQCYAIDLSNDLVFLGSRGGLTIIDVSSPSTPELVGRFVLRAEDQVSSLSVWGDYLVLTTRRQDYVGREGVRYRLQVFDVSDPASPVRTFVSDDLEQALQALVLREVLFVASGSLGVRVFDIADLHAPRDLGLIPMDGVVAHLMTNGEALYAAQRAGGLGVIHTGTLPVR